MLESKMASLEARLTASPAASAGRNPHDPALRRLAFIGFPESMYDTQRIEVMEAFMKWNFASERFSHADHFPDKNGFPSNNGFVEFGSNKHARRIAEEVKKRNLKVYNHLGVTVKPALTEVDLNRNWALRVAEKKIREDANSANKAVVVKKGEGRGVYVNDVKVFAQEPRYAKDGQFTGAFAHLTLR